MFSSFVFDIGDHWELWFLDGAQEEKKEGNLQKREEQATGKKKKIVAPFPSVAHRRPSSMALSASSGITLLQRYLEACEKHGVVANLDIQNSISEAQDSPSDFILKLNMEQLTEADMMALADMLSYINSFDCHAVDVTHNREIHNGQLLLRVLRSVGPKLRIVDLKKSTFGRDVMRDLLHRGMQCQYLNMSFSRFRKLDMIGHFPQLHTLILDFNVYLTDLPEGCFKATPSLTRISMCETKAQGIADPC
ncbi:hypothetical protein GOP47_0000039 [Adiantum capillus-veneris]|uniref:DWD hypersensitive to UV-B 1 N-terminal domain-containing protein n=1 Tax=Adiantum capillus-veneris TaxID=13818 RepID=A0A9D4VD61_ADICA|nr:hypothetical protein GOP47_0000039 [Adiantum capillus-veneris]